MSSEDLEQEFESEKESNFYKKLREKVNSYIESKAGDSPYADYILLAPDLFYLLYKLTTDSRVPGKYRLQLIGAVAYFIMPVDLIPEAIVGPVGFADDIILACYVLDNLLNEVGDEVVLDHWPGEEDILEQIRNILDAAGEWIGQARFEKIKNWLGGLLKK